MKNSKFTSKLAIIITIFVVMVASLALSACGVIVDDPACTHPNTEWYVENEATCTEDGYRIKKCTTCGQRIDGTGEKIKATGHKESDWIVDIAATCTKDGH